MVCVRTNNKTTGPTIKLRSRRTLAGLMSEERGATPRSDFAREVEDSHRKTFLLLDDFM